MVLFYMAFLLLITSQLVTYIPWILVWIQLFCFVKLQCFWSVTEVGSWELHCWVQWLAEFFLEANWLYNISRTHLKADGKTCLIPFVRMATFGKSDLRKFFVRPWSDSARFPKVHCACTGIPAKKCHGAFSAGLAFQTSTYVSSTLVACLPRVVLSCWVRICRIWYPPSPVPFMILLDCMAAHCIQLHVRSVCSWFWII